MPLFRRGRLRALALEEISHLVGPFVEGYGVKRVYVSKTGWFRRTSWPS